MISGETQIRSMRWGLIALQYIYNFEELSVCELDSVDISRFIEMPIKIKLVINYLDIWCISNRDRCVVKSAGHESVCEKRGPYTAKILQHSHDLTKGQSILAQPHQMRMVINANSK